MSKETLVGLYFLGNSTQGRVVDIVDNGFYLAQLFEWWTGSPSNMVLIPLEELKEYRFYSDAEVWREAGSQSFKKPLKIKELQS